MRYTKKYSVCYCLYLAVTAGTWTAGTEVGRDCSARSGYRMAPIVSHGHSRGHVPSHKEVCLQVLHLYALPTQ